MRSFRYLPGLLVFLFCFCSSHSTRAQSLSQCRDSLCHFQMISDTFFNTPQRINLLVLKKNALSGYGIEMACRTDSLFQTSRIAEEHFAIAAINGSFFDRDKGGSVSYFEQDDSVYSRTRAPGLKWGVSDSIINAAMVLHKNHIFGIESARSEQFYEESGNESFVMVSGPLLLKDSIPQKLPEMNFTYTRHPRTCVGITREAIILITIDGRSDMAYGMNLFEVQKFLLALGCLDAINLDGGGSTTMWIKEKGIVNTPSDKTGERPVANALLILKKCGSAGSTASGPLPVSKTEQSREQILEL